jgi:hypothetical protein
MIKPALLFFGTTTDDDAGSYSPDGEPTIPAGGVIAGDAAIVGAIGML